MDYLNTTTASCFIVPNSLSRLGNMWDAEQRLSALNRLAELNDWDPFTNDDILVQVWLHDNETLKCDNLIDHYWDFTTGNTNYSGRISFYYGMLPISLFNGKKEGDSIKVKIPVTALKGQIPWLVDNPQREEVEIGINMDGLKLQQKGFRYSNYGTFEEVLEKLKATSTVA